MNRHIIAKMVRATAGAALVACTLGYAVPGHAAFKRLFSYLSHTGPSGCANDAAGNSYYSGTWGYTSSLGTVCNVGSTGSTAQTWCLNTAVWHSTDVEALQSSGYMNVVASSPLQQTWTNTSTITYSIPATSTCPAGNTTTSYGWGRAYN